MPEETSGMIHMSTCVYIYISHVERMVGGVQESPLRTDCGDHPKKLRGELRATCPLPTQLQYTSRRVGLMA